MQLAALRQAQGFQQAADSGQPISHLASPSLRHYAALSLGIEHRVFGETSDTWLEDRGQPFQNHRTSEPQRSEVSKSIRKLENWRIRELV